MCDVNVDVCDSVWWSDWDNEIWKGWGMPLLSVCKCKNKCKGKSKSESESESERVSVREWESESESTLFKVITVKNNKTVAFTCNNWLSPTKSWFCTPYTINIYNCPWRTRETGYRGTAAEDRPLRNAFKATQHWYWNNGKIALINGPWRH